jgi:hypothetical protein
MEQFSANINCMQKSDFVTILLLHIFCDIINL